MKVRFLPLAAIMCLGCAGPGPGVCGEGTDPVVVTGLNGVLDGATLAVEIAALVPATCEESEERVWMLFDDPVLTLGPEPSGILMRGGVEVTDETIFFRDRNVGVRLEYPGGVVGPVLRLVWFSTGTDLAAVQCTAAPLACAIE